MLSRYILSRGCLLESAIVASLKADIQATAKTYEAPMTRLKKELATKKVGDLTVDMVIGGMRGISGLLTETSDLDPIKGIKYRGLSLSEVNAKLPKAGASGAECALPEGVLWLLLTGKAPSVDQVSQLTKELHSRAKGIPQATFDLIDSLPKTMHPMTQLSIAVLAMQPTSKFAKAYSGGQVKKSEYWALALEDTLDLVARIPIVAARIYRNVFHDGKGIRESDESMDWAGNFANLLGVGGALSKVKREQFLEVTRLYLTLHADHEGGNVSAHGVNLVGSALSDLYYAWTAGLCGLAGPLHGLANQECLKWLEDMHGSLKAQGITKIEKSHVEKYAADTLAKGRVIPGYGHAVLRHTDPRFLLQREFALKHMGDDPLVKLVDLCFQVIPGVLEKTGKVKNPFPNVDAHSGVCMKHYGLVQPDYYTVIFAVSRTIGVSAQYVWNRVLNLPIERPKSVSVEWLLKKATETK